MERSCSSVLPSQVSPEVVQVDVGLLPLGQHVFDESLSLPRLCAGQKHLAHRVGHLGLVSGCAFSLSVKSRKCKSSTRNSSAV